MFDTAISHMLCLMILILILRTRLHSSASPRVRTVATRLQQLVSSRHTEIGDHSFAASTKRCCSPDNEPGIARSHHLCPLTPPLASSLKISAFAKCETLTWCPVVQLFQLSFALSV